MRYDKEEIESIKEELQAWRDYALNMPIDSMFDELLIERLLFDKAKDGRLAELYYPLYRVTPLSCKYVIEEYLELEAQSKIQLALASFECEIFKALLDTYGENTASSWVSTQDVLDTYNESHIMAQITIRTMHSKLRELGLSPQRTTNARGFAVNQKIIENLKERFRFTDVVQTTL